MARHSEQELSPGCVNYGKDKSVKKTWPFFFLSTTKRMHERTAYSLLFTFRNRLLYLQRVTTYEWIR